MIILMREKGFTPILILVIILIIAGIVGGAFYFNKSLVKSSTQLQTTVPTMQLAKIATGSAETINWKTFQNSKYGFSLKYPSSWNVDNSEGMDMKGNIAFGVYLRNFTPSAERGTNAIDKNLDKGKAQISISKNVKPSNITLEQFIDQEANNFRRSTGQEGNVSLLKTQLLVNNKEAVQTESPNFKGPFPNIAIYIKKTETELYVINASLDYPSYSQTFEQILSTFKFTD